MSQSVQYLSVVWIGGNYLGTKQNSGTQKMEKGQKITDIIVFTNHRMKTERGVALSVKADRKERKKSWVHPS